MDRRRPGALGAAVSLGLARFSYALLLPPCAPTSAGAVRSLLHETAFAFDDREAVIQAAEMFERGHCRFSDCLIIAKHARQGCDFTATFDLGMRKLPGARVL